MIVQATPPSLVKKWGTYPPIPLDLRHWLLVPDTNRLASDTTNGTTQMPKFYITAVKHGMFADATANLCDDTDVECNSTV